MSDRKLTVLELHFHSDEGVQFGPRSIGDALGRGEHAEPEPEAEADTTGRRLPGPLVAGGVLTLLVIAGVAWRVLRER